MSLMAVNLFLHTISWLFNHVVVIAGAEQKIVTDWQSEKPSEPVARSLIQASGKLVLIDKLLPKLKQSGHKVCRESASFLHHLRVLQGTCILCMYLAKGAGVKISQFFGFAHRSTIQISKYFCHFSLFTQTHFWPHNSLCARFYRLVLRSRS